MKTCVHREDDPRRDITSGSVDGVTYVGEEPDVAFYEDIAPVGFFCNDNVKGSPAHQ